MNEAMKRKQHGLTGPVIAALKIEIRHRSIDFYSQKVLYLDDIVYILSSIYWMRCFCVVHVPCIHNEAPLRMLWMVQDSPKSRKLRSTHRKSLLGHGITSQFATISDSTGFNGNCSQLMETVVSYHFCIGIDIFGCLLWMRLLGTAFVIREHRRERYPYLLAAFTFHSLDLCATLTSTFDFHFETAAMLWFLVQMWFM